VRYATIEIGAAAEADVPRLLEIRYGAFATKQF
jgi:hypothetical protein